VVSIGAITPRGYIDVANQCGCGTILQQYANVCRHEHIADVMSETTNKTETIFNEK